MIRIVRPPEPTALPSVRATQLAAARDALSAGRPITFAGHGTVKDDLFTMQQRKCCYCEKREEQAKYRDVEHFRPKARYWWLAWTWENLLFACVDCNREHKREQFPLAPGSTPLLPEQSPPGGEHPLLLDPAAEDVDPMDEIVFRRMSIQREERWMPVGQTDRGRETIRVCRLDRQELVTSYTHHVRDLVRPKLSTFLATSRDGDAQAVHRAWSTLHRGLLGRAQPFRALSHDALAALVDPALRERHGLRLPRPT